MATLEDMFCKTTSTPLYDCMIRSVSSFCDYFNMNQLYYVKIFSTGYFIALGTHMKWYEYLLSDAEMLQKSPILRQSGIAVSGVTLLKNTLDPKTIDFLDMSWKKFKINYTLHIQRKRELYIECVGFGVNSNHPTIDGCLLNELPLIFKIFEYFCEENRKLINLAEDNRVAMNTSELFNFFKSVPDLISDKKARIFRQLGLGSALLLSSRELDVLKYIAYGYSANYIAKKLFVSTRTVEHHISSIKLKLDCDLREELIKRAYEISSIIHLETI